MLWLLTVYLPSVEVGFYMTLSGSSTPSTSTQANNIFYDCIRSWLFDISIYKDVEFSIRRHFRADRRLVTDSHTTCPFHHCVVDHINKRHKWWRRRRDLMSLMFNTQFLIAECNANTISKSNGIFISNCHIAHRMQYWHNSKIVIWS
jgi:hypothetical protein